MAKPRRCSSTTCKARSTHEIAWRDHAERPKIAPACRPHLLSAMERIPRGRIQAVTPIGVS